MILLLSAALVSGIEFSASDAEIVLDRNAVATARFAARELKTFLDGSLGGDIPIVNEPCDRRKQIVVGENRWSKEAGIDLAGMPRDGFVIKSAGKRVYIAGRDSNSDIDALISRGRPTDLRSLMRSERATAFGVYEFLERFAGCRFYFPGEMGTIVPRRRSLKVPDGMLIKRSPAFTERHVSTSGGMPLSTQMLNWVRIRLETDHLQCGHGLNSFDYARRFADSNPEYFCLLKNGKRAAYKVDPYPGGKMHSVGQLCHTSGIWKEITEDALSFLRGEPADRRMGKGRGWQKNCRGIHVDIMPQDGMWKCMCGNCLAAYDKGPDYADTLIWRRTAEVARSITAAGLNGRVCQMAYSPFSQVPDFDLPGNIDVMVATAGPWSIWDDKFYSRAIRVVHDWHRKIGRDVWLWTYPGKVNAMNIPAAPQVAPRAWGEYYKRTAPFIFGAFNESESDSFYFNYLNFYVFSRIAWDTSVDVDGIIAEHHRLMYGKGATEMAKFFDRLESIWLKDVVRESSTTSIGGEPSYSPPGTYRLLTQVYSKAVLEELRGYIGKAAAAEKKNSPAWKRIRFAGEELLGPIYRRARTFQSRLDPEDESVRRKKALSVRTVSADAKWWCKGMKAKNDGGRIEFTVERGGKAQLSLAAAGITLKPGTSYRVSCFIETELEELPFEQLKKGNGLLFELSEDAARKHLHRVTGICGNRPRETHGFEFTTPSEAQSGGCFAFRAYGVSGKIKVDGIAVMELPR